MIPLDIRAPEPGLGAGSAKPLSPNRQHSTADFDDAFHAAGEGSTRKGDAPGDQADEPSSGKRFSWDPRMKEAASDAGSGKDVVEDAAGQLSETGEEALPGTPDQAGAAGGDRDDRKKDNGKKDGETIAAVPPVTVTAPHPAQTTTAKPAGGDRTAQTAPALVAVKVGLLSKQAASDAEAPADRENRPPLVMRAGEEQAKGGPSALAALGSRLAELADGGDGTSKADAPRAEAAKAQAPAPGNPSEPVSNAKDSHAATKADATDALATPLRLLGNPQAARPGVTAITAGIVSSPAWARALASPDPAAAQSAGPVNALRIQLHPADLGVVTATLRLSGDHLVIDLKVETAAAYRQLSADNAAIVDKLKGHGYVVESVTIQHVAVDRPAAPQPQQAPGFPNPHAGGQAAAGGGGRPFEQNGGNSRGGSPHLPDEQSMGTRETAAPSDGARRAAGGIYV